MRKDIVQNRRNEAGFTLLELLLVVGVGSILLLAGIGTYRLVTEGNKANEGSRLITTVKQQVQNLYQGQTTYGAVSLNALLVNSGAFPSTALNGAQPVHPWNGDITVTGAGNTFTIEFEALPDDACIAMARLEVANDPDFSEIDVGASNYTTLPTPVQANADCTGDSTDIVWTFF